MIGVLWPALAITAIIGGAVLAVITPNGFPGAIVCVSGYIALGVWLEKEDF